jgi:hypothetical protein
MSPTLIQLVFAATEQRDREAGTRRLAPRSRRTRATRRRLPATRTVR